MGVIWSSRKPADPRCPHGMVIYLINDKTVNVCVKCKENYTPMVKDHKPIPQPYAKYNKK
jgi:hypothetical protein